MDTEFQNNSFEVRQRKLPHWNQKNSAYFITFTAYRTVLSEYEQKIVLDKISESDSKMYITYCAIVMPDHVHLVIQPLVNLSISQIMQKIKGGSARLINIARKSTGRIWMEEYFDRIIRDEEEFQQKMNYIFNNPLKAGLTYDPLNYSSYYLKKDD